MPDIYTVLDLETTGFSAAYMCDIIEIGAYKTDGVNILDSFHMYIKPYKAVPKKIEELTGITNQLLEDKPNKWNVLPKFSKFIENTIVVAHNAEFDVNFLNISFYNLNLPLITKYICTQTLFKNNFPKEKSNLEAVCSHYGITNDAAHSAFCDAKATVEVFIKMFSTLRIVPTYYNDRDIFVKTLKRIVGAIPFNNVRKELCKIPECKIKETPINTYKVIECFYKKKLPITITEEYGFNYKEVSKLFYNWLNPIRITRFFEHMNNKQVTKFIKEMISLSGTFEELISLHTEIFGKEANIDIYTLYWISNNKDIVFNFDDNDFNWHFDQGKSIKHISKEFSISPYTVADRFVNYAIKNKTEENKRIIIASKLCKRSELTSIVKKDEFLNTLNPNPSDDDLKKYLSYELYKKNFFSIKLD